MRKRPPSHPFRVSVVSSVRTRLTLWYLAIMAGIVLAFGGSLYATQTFLNADASESRLQARLASESPRLTDAYSQGLRQRQQLAALHLPLSAQEIVLLLTPTGRMLDARGPLTESMLRQLQARAGQNTGVIDLVVPQSRAHGWWSASSTYLVLIAPVLDRNARVATLLVGLQRQDSLPFWMIWLIHGTLALLVAAIGGYWLAGKALRPVKMITRMANEINATDLRRRLHLQRRDEFGMLAATFDQMLSRLEAAFKRQTRFAADASHELRTPLTIIDLEINRALTQLERPEEYQRVLEQIRAENEQMIAIVNSLLLLARADTGQMMLDLQVVDLSDIALACVERLLPLAQRSRVALATGDLPEVLVRGDPRYLGQLLANLIENAIKYTSGVGKRVHIELACEQGGRGVVRVQDDGPGISQEHLPYLFERFYRVDRARSPRQKEAVPGDETPGGSGLGLSIVQWIAQAHGGEVCVESYPSSGSLFVVFLPLVAAPSAGEQKEAR